MLGDITVATNIYIVTGYTDMRKSIDGLCSLVTDKIKILLTGQCKKLLTVKCKKCLPSYVKNSLPGGCKNTLPPTPGWI